MQITFLGTGSSSGIPSIDMISNNNKIFQMFKSKTLDKKNIRTRCSTLFSKNEKNLLIDASPDIRYQFLKNCIKSVDALIITHIHHDHTAGINELKALFNHDKRLDIYAKDIILKDLTLYYEYVFDEIILLKEKNTIEEFELKALSIIQQQKLLLYKNANYPSFAKQHILNDECKIFDFHIKSYIQDHIFVKSTGLIIDNVGYVTDVAYLSEADLQKLQGIEHFIVGCLRKDKCYTHANFNLVLEWRNFIKPKFTYLTHMDYSMDYYDLVCELPKDIIPAYDGMILDA